METLIESPRLMMRPIEATDAEAVAHWAGDRRVAEVTKLIPQPYVLEDAIEWIESILRDQHEGRFEVFAIVLRETGGLIGCIELSPSEDADVAEFGYWIGVEFWGRGYATEALGGILRFGFLDLGFRKIEAHHYAHNPASGRVMEKAGLRNVGVRDGEQYDQVVYALSAREWKLAQEAARKPCADELLANHASSFEQ